MQSSVSRRRYVQLLGLSAAIGLAGCSDGTADTETDGDDGGTEADQQNSGDGAGQTDSSDDSGAEERTDTPRLRDVFNWEDSYIMEMTSTEGSGTTVYHRGDSHSSWSMNGDQFESYHIDGDHYSVFDGQCYLFQSDLETEEFDPEEPVEDDEEYYATGTTTIEGQEVYEFDLGDGLYYLSVDTGYPVRYVGQEGVVVDFHSWGETSPISPPDMECLDI